jgi:hypothetical protein
MSTAQQTAGMPLPEVHAGQGRRRSRLWYLTGVGVLGLALLGGQYPANPPTNSIPPVPPPGPQPMPQEAQGQAVVPTAAAVPVAPTNAMEQAVVLLEQARTAYAAVQDYTCLLVKRERAANGTMPPDNLVQMKVRVQPFSVFLHWQAPPSMAGQEVCYVAGRNDGKMRVHPVGLLGAVGFISLDPNDPRVRQNSRHSISEAGIGNIIDRYARAWETERNHPEGTHITIAEFEYNRRRCYRVEALHPADSRGRFPCYRSLVYFDKENHLPIRVEVYDWPRRPGDTGELIESYSFANLRLNVGLGDPVFNH